MSKSSNKVVATPYAARTPKIIRVEHPDEDLFARPLTGGEVMRLVELAQGATEVESVGLFAFITANCMVSVDGRPCFQGEKDKAEVEKLPFSVVRAVAEACLKECGLDNDAMFATPNATP